MNKKNTISIIGLMLSLILIAASFAGCSKKDDGETTEAFEAVADTTEETTVIVTTTLPPTTTETTTASTQTVQKVVDTLNSKVFYMSGTMELAGGETVNAKIAVNGDDSRIDMDSSKMKMAMITYGGTPYVVNTSTNKYVEINQQTIDSMDSVLKSFSSYGVTFNTGDIDQIKNMMSNFDTTFDYSQYIDNAKPTDSETTIDGETYLCSLYESEYGRLRVYTQEGELRMIEAYDSDGLMQMNFTVDTFMPVVATPISLNGLTKSTSLVNLFTAS